VKPQRRASAGTGYEDGLYKLEGLRSGDPQQLEKEFFRVIDNDAAQALEQLEAGNTSLSPFLRKSWSTFILSLMMRTPSEVEELKRLLQPECAASLPGLAESYAKIRKRDDSPSPGEFIAKIWQEQNNDVFRQIFEGLIDHGALAALIGGMIWSVLDLPDDVPELMTSDRPVMTFGAWGGPTAFIFLPIGPRRLFFSVNIALAVTALKDMPKADLISAVNLQVIQQATRYGYSSSDAVLAFMQEHLAVSPRETLLGRLRAV
jgi:hypothetical protein